MPNIPLVNETVEEDAAALGKAIELFSDVTPAQIEQSVADSASAVTQAEKINKTKSSSTGLLLNRLAIDSEDLNVLVIGDSTGNSSSEWVYLIAQWYAQQWPSYSVDFRFWDDVAKDYADVINISTGTGPNTLTIWNFSVAGSNIEYQLGVNFQNAVLNVPDAQLIYMNHSHNMYSSLDDDFTTKIRVPRLVGGIAQTIQHHSSAGLVMIAQNPRRDDDEQFRMTEAVYQAAGLLNADVADAYSLFIEQNKDASLYTDNIHPNDAGTQLFVQAVKDIHSSDGIPKRAISPFDNQTKNIIPNGEFLDFSAAVPDEISLISGTLTKDTTVFLGEKGYSVKLVGAGSRIRYEAPTWFKNLYNNKWVTFAVRVFVEVGASSTAGRISVSMNVDSTTTSTALTDAQGAWHWRVVTAKIDNTGYVWFNVYGGDNGATYIDKMVATLGRLPANSVDITIKEHTATDYANDLAGRKTAVEIESAINSRDSIFASEFGLVLNGTTDDAIKFQEMSDFAEQNNKKIVVDGPLYASTTVNIYNDIEFTSGGYLVFSGQTQTLLNLTSKNEGSTIDPLTVTGLTELSSSVGGFSPSPCGFAVIDSSEELIKRTSGGLFTKDELIVFSDSNGNLSVPVYENHNLANILSLKYFYPEMPIKATNIHIRTLSGAPSVASVEGLVTVSLRSVIATNVLIQGIENTLTNWVNTKTPSVLMINPKIDGSILGKGYGVRNTITSCVTIFHPQISNCREGITGRHDKNTLVSGGGYVSDTIDSHYGYNMTISDGVTVSGNINFAGRDISVKRITQKSTEGGIIQRNDTPEIKGRVSYCDNNVIIDSAINFYGYYFGPSAPFNFGRTLHQPCIVEFKNNVFTIETTPLSIRYIGQIQSTASDLFRIKKIHISGNIIDDENITPQVLSFTNKTDKMLGSYDTVVLYENEEKGAFFIQDLTAVFDDSWGFDITINNVNGIISRIDSTALKGGVIRDSKVLRLENETSSDLSANILGVWDIKDSDIRGIARENHKHIMASDGFLELLPDDSAQKINLLPYRKYGRATVFIENNIGRCGEVVFDAGTAIGIINVANGASFETTTGVLTGVTGTDGRLTVSVDNDVLYIENRSGSAKNIYYSIR